MERDPGVTSPETKEGKKEIAKRRFGEIAMEIAKNLRKKDLEDVLKDQATDKRKRLGETLVEKGLLTQNQVNEILAIQNEEDLAAGYGTASAMVRKQLEERKQEIEKARQQELLKKHLQSLKSKQQETESYRFLTLPEKRVHQALLKWYNGQKLPLPDGILELHFNKKVCVTQKYELILGSFDSTEKIKRLQGSSKLKEMLLAFERGKKVIMEWYNRDLQEKIYTFMFLKGKIQPQPRVPEVTRVISHFMAWHQKKVPPQPL